MLEIKDTAYRHTIVDEQRGQATQLAKSTNLWVGVGVKLTLALTPGSPHPSSFGP